MSYPTNEADQQAYIADLVARLNVVEGYNNVIEVVKATEPTQLDFVSRWLAQGLTLPIKPGYEFHWFDGTRLRGSYGAIEEGFFVLNTGIQMGTLPSISPVPGDEVYVVNDNVEAASLMTGLYLCTLDQTNTRKFISSNLYRDWHPCFNSTATQIACTTNQNAVRFDILKMNRDGSSRTILTTNGNNYSPSWRKNKIVFHAYKPAHLASTEIYIMAEDGTGETRLTSAGVNDKLACISPDANKIAFLSSRSGVGYSIWTMNADGSNQTDLNISAESVRWSPDGSKLYYSSTRLIVNNVNDIIHTFYTPGLLPVSEIYSVNPDGSNIQRLTDYYGVGDPGQDVINIAVDPRPYTNNKLYLSDSFNQVLYNGFDVFPDETRFMMTCKGNASSPVINLVIQSNQRNLKGSTGKVHRLVSWDTPYSDIELLDSFTPNIAGILSWRTDNMANRPEFSHLLIIHYGKVVNASVNVLRLLIQINDDETPADYRTLTDMATGVTLTQQELLGTQPGAMVWALATTGVLPNSMGGGIIWVPDYNEPTILKTMLSVGGAPMNYATVNNRILGMGMNLWNKTDPITSLTFRCETITSPFQLGTKISVYGILGSGRYFPT